MCALQYQKLCRESNESAQEWIGRLQTKVPKCRYKDPDRLLTEQFIGGLNDDGMTDENIEKSTSRNVLGWACRVGAQRAQRSMLNNINESNDFYAI